MQEVECQTDKMAKRMSDILYLYIIVAYIRLTLHPSEVYVEL